MSNPKSQFADVDRVIGNAMRAFDPNSVSYSDVQAEIDALLESPDADVAAGCRRANLMLARIAASPAFDAARHRAIAQALRALARSAPNAPITLQTRGGR